jgi:threonine dehydrogenase-like Zn-dependent dehydrogenase
MLGEKGRAAVWIGSRRIKIMELPIPKAEEDGAVIKVDATAICGSDGNLFPMTPPYPALLGHEITGTIVDLGREANSRLNVFGGPLKTGDRVVLYPWITCGKCSSCLTFGPGKCTICENSFFYGAPSELFGIVRPDGVNDDVNKYPYFKRGFGEYLYIFPETYLWKLPGDMPSEVAALLDPMAVAVRAVELACMSPGVVEESFTVNSTITVIGDGPIGALCALVSRIMGVEKIIIIGGRNKRLSIAADLSQADCKINYKETSPEERVTLVKDITGGKGADVVFQCSNQPQAFVQGLEMMRRMGTLVEVGNTMDKNNDIPINVARHICGKHARILGMTVNTSEAFNKAFHLLMRHKKIDFLKMYTHICSLDSLETTLNSMKNEDYFKGLLNLNLNKK